MPNIMTPEKQLHTPCNISPSLQHQFSQLLKTSWKINMCNKNLQPANFSSYIWFHDICGTLPLGVGDHIAPYMRWSNLIKEYFADDRVFCELALYAVMDWDWAPTLSKQITVNSMARRQQHWVLLMVMSNYQLNKCHHRVSTPLNAVSDNNGEMAKYRTLLTKQNYI